jgi:hypothetical protein
MKSYSTSATPRIAPNFRSCWDGPQLVSSGEEVPADVRLGGCLVCLRGFSLYERHLRGYHCLSGASLSPFRMHRAEVTEDRGPDVRRGVRDIVCGLKLWADSVVPGFYRRRRVVPLSEAGNLE